MLLKSMTAMIASCMLIFCLLSGRSPDGLQAHAGTLPALEGIYEFVSESTEISKPTKSVLKRESHEWMGRWQFQDGYFSSTLMKRGARNARFEPQDADFSDFEFYAGTYKTEGNAVILKWEFAISPLVIGRVIAMEYRFDKESLILKETIHQNEHSVYGGIKVITLRRIH